tara:strand:+ start:4189 stop:4707 length:519 start_codon:yes stop_codon:yes gene_type:complete
MSLLYMENYLDTHIQNTGQYQTMINGNVIDNTKWSLAYNGDELNLEAKNNDKAIYMNLNKDEILKLFEVPAYHKSIDKRLEDNLLEENEIDIRPIIIEEIEKLIPRKKVVHKKKTKRKGKKKTKRKGKKSSHVKHDTDKSKSKSKSKRKSKSHSRHEAHHNTITPDYLKTIY